MTQPIKKISEGTDLLLQAGGDKYYNLLVEEMALEKQVKPLREKKERLLTDVQRAMKDYDRKERMHPAQVRLVKANLRKLMRELSEIEAAIHLTNKKVCQINRDKMHLEKRMRRMM